MPLFPSLTFEQEAEIHQAIAWNVIYLSAPVFLTLNYVVAAPWGKLLDEEQQSLDSLRDRRDGKSPLSLSSILSSGPRIPARVAWFLCELTW